MSENLDSVPASPERSFASYVREHRWAIALLVLGVIGTEARHRYKKAEIDRHISLIQAQTARSKAAAERQRAMYESRRRPSRSQRDIEADSHQVIERIREAQHAAFRVACGHLSLDTFLTTDALAMLDRLKQRVDQVTAAHPDSALLTDRRYFPPNAVYVSYNQLATWLTEYWTEKLETTHLTAEQMADLTTKYRFLTHLLPRVNGAGEIYIHRLIRDGQKNGTVNERVRMLWGSAMREPLEDDPSRAQALSRRYIQGCVAHLGAEDQAIFHRVLATHLPLEQSVWPNE